MEYGLIGEHLGHSFSREVHAKLSDIHYELKEIPREGLEDFMRAADFKGINVTIPYKAAVIPYLDDISDRARALNAVNTIVNRGGRLFGDNTDYPGFIAMARNAGVELKGRKVLILGAGGAASTADAAARDLGASSVTHAVRNPKAPGQIRIADLTADNDYEVLINCTPVGMYPNNGDRIVDIDMFPKLSGVLDCIYNPLRTNLVLDARRRGLPSDGGLYMLVAQACFAQEIFLDTEIDRSRIDGIYREILSQKENVVLTGMPSCGKSTLGFRYAQMTGKPLVDTDDIIRKRTGIEISSYFKKFGEQSFRDLETEVIREVSMKQGQVISVGGGAVLRPGNVHELKTNGRVFLIDRALEKLMATSDRPLSRDRESLAKLYEVRRPVYLASADITIDNNGTPEKALEELAGAA